MCWIVPLTGSHREFLRVGGAAPVAVLIACGRGGSDPDRISERARTFDPRQPAGVVQVLDGG